VQQDHLGGQLEGDEAPRAGHGHQQRPPLQQRIPVVSRGRPQQARVGRLSCTSHGARPCTHRAHTMHALAMHAHTVVHEPCVHLHCGPTPVVGRGVNWPGHSPLNVLRGDIACRPQYRRRSHARTQRCNIDQAVVRAPPNHGVSPRRTRAREWPTRTAPRDGLQQGSG
jgi:hypothetical protein